eukprot:CAMPEP_0194191188 /NCGR_PEP_ID=MMETSP0154-20130528/65848_1 /TAXON_ID=1049557 /ORGANISM="Thalassiothrix antarctica, Strain L6-D1" /LENGTH=203 /DNA_ID=CAMNT_0038913665 /DNA_START=141 /DNA_END=749 /DNA_ORIENTATION=+
MAAVEVAEEAEMTAPIEPKVRRYGSPTRIKILSPMTDCMIAALPIERKSSVSSSSSMKYLSPSTSLSSLCAKGSNFHDSLAKTGAGIQGEKSSGKEEDTMTNDCNLVTTIAITCEDRNSYEIPLSSTSYKNINTSLCRVLSSMSDDQLLIINDSSNGEENELVVSNNKVVENSSAKSHNLYNEVPVVVTNNQLTKHMGLMHTR